MTEDNEILRYPIGRFQPPDTVATAQREQWIEEIAYHPQGLRDAVQNLSDSQLDTPYRPEGWTLRQVVHHIPDSHANAYVRFRLALTEDVPRIKPYLEHRWAELDDARSAPIDDSLRLVEALHVRWVRLLRSMDEEDWLRAYDHPESGPVQLSRALGLYAWHGRHHAAHITTLRKRENW